MTQLNQYKSLLTTELTYILKVKGLPTSGTKPEKISRLLEHDRVSAEHTETPKKRLSKSPTSKAKARSPKGTKSTADTSSLAKQSQSSLHWMTKCRPVSDYVDEMEANDADYDRYQDPKLKVKSKKDACQYCGSPFKMCKQPMDKCTDYGWFTTEEGLQKAQSLMHAINVRVEGPDEILYNDWDGYAELEALQNYVSTCDCNLHSTKTFSAQRIQQRVLQEGQGS